MNIKELEQMYGVYKGNLGVYSTDPKRNHFKIINDGGMFMKRMIGLVLSIVMLCLLLPGCEAGTFANAPVNETEQQLDWQLHCARISADGKVLETGIVCELTGVYSTAENAADVFSLELTTPDGYQYCIPNDSGNTAENKADKWDFAEVDVPYFVSMWYGYNKTENVPQFAGFALDVGKGYFMIRWHGTQEYLVCATDADTDLTAVFEYFEVFRGSEIQNALAQEKDSIQIDWSMYGTWVTAKDVTTQKVNFSISGTVTENSDGVDVLDVNIDFPNSFNYGFEGQHDPYTSESGKQFGLEYYVCATYSYDRYLNEGVFSHFALSTEREFAIFYWENYPTHFLVASKNPNADPAEILTYFEDFVVKYNLN